MIDPTEPGARYLDQAAPASIRARLDWCEALRDEVPFMTYEEWRRFVVPKLVRSLTQNELAYWGCIDRYFLVTVLCGRRDAWHPWLYDRCREVEFDPDGFLDLWSRYHYKSTFITFGGVIQEILRDPEITVGIFAATQQVARPFLAQIKREFESNEKLTTLYPDVLWSNPRKEAPRWSDEDGIIVRRAGNPKEGTVEAHGLIGALPPGRHFPLLVYDDLVTQDLVTNPEMIAKCTAAWELSTNLGAGEKTRRWHVGTRYHFGDTYGALIQRGSLKPRIYPATDDGTKDGIPVLLSQKAWDEVVRDQRSTYAAQMLQNPMAGKDNVFMPGWFRPYEARPATVGIYIMVDPSKGRSATSDNTAIAVVALDTAGNKYLVDGYCHRMTLSERWTAVRDLVRKWRNRPGVDGRIKVGWEQYGLAVDVEYVKERQQIEGEHFPVEELNWTRDNQGQSKGDRVERLEPDMRDGRFWFPRLVWATNVGAICTWALKGNEIVYTPTTGETNVVRQLVATGQGHRVARPIKRTDENREVYDVTVKLLMEMQLFPFGSHDDLVDAVSRIYDLSPTTPNPGEDAAARELNAQLQA